jgi:hypothetical protein
MAAEKSALTTAVITKAQDEIARLTVERLVRDNRANARGILGAFGPLLSNAANPIVAFQKVLQPVELP